MIPMIINVKEFKDVLERIERAKVELTHEGKSFSNDVQVGIMVETPSAAVMTPVLAKYVDFFSICTLVCWSVQPASTTSRRLPSR